MYAVIKRELTDVWIGFLVWTGPDLPKARAARHKGTENFAIIGAAGLPWSTSAISICGLAFLLGFLSTVKPVEFLRSLKHPASLTALALCLLAVLGLLWADGLSWPERFRGLTPIAKFLGIPVLIYYFSQTDRGRYVFYAFAASCALLMLYSWVALYWPGVSIHYKSDQPGVPVKNYIDQSQGFVFCAFVLAAIAMEAFRQGRRMVSLFAAIIAIALLANLAFVNVARTALVYSPILAVLLAFRYLGRKQFWIACFALPPIIAGLWVISPNLQHKVSAAFTEYRAAQNERGTTSVGQRLELWSKSIALIEKAPVIGHGTGSARVLLTRDAPKQANVPAIGNPHNQTFLFMIQWGLLGALSLYAMWIAHLLTFRGEGLVAWIGLVAVVQNILSSLFNSHLSDFYQGWLYVMAVGIAAGTLTRTTALTGDESVKADRHRVRFSPA